MAPEKDNYYVGPLRVMASEDPDRFYEVSKAVRELGGNPGLGFVLEQLKRREDRAVTAMVDGDAILTQAGYANLAGEIAGFRAAQRVLDTVLVVAAEQQRKFDQAAAEAAGE